MEDKNTVVAHGQEFHLVEPPFGVVHRIVKILSRVGQRAVRNAAIGNTIVSVGDQAAAQQVAEGEGGTAAAMDVAGEFLSSLLSGVASVVFGILAEVTEHDLLCLGSAVLQFEDDADGRRWWTDRGLLYAPIVQALIINIRLSSDIQETIKAFLSATGIKAEKKAAGGAKRKKETES